MVCGDTPRLGVPLHPLLESELRWFLGFYGIQSLGDTVLVALLAIFALCDLVYFIHLCTPIYAALLTLSSSAQIVSPCTPVLYCPYRQNTYP